MADGDSFLDDLDDEDEPEEAEAVPVDGTGDGNVDLGNGPTKNQQSHVGEQADNTLLKPVTEDLAEIAETYETYSKIKNELLVKSDIQTISGNAFIKKSGLRKIATAFNISVQVVDSKRIVNDGVVRYEVRAQASAPNGKSSDGIGMAGSNESNFTEVVDGEFSGESPEDNVFRIDGKLRRLPHPRAVNEHNLQALAETRAKNRAISDLVGGGDVSAEEMSADQFFD